LSWEEWESKRRRRMRVRKKDYWKKGRKEKEDFGQEEGRELGHDVTNTLPLVFRLTEND